MWRNAAVALGAAVLVAGSFALAGLAAYGVVTWAMPAVGPGVDRAAADAAQAAAIKAEIGRMEYELAWMASHPNDRDDARAADLEERIRRARVRLSGLSAR